MSNIIKVPHTITFLAEINIDKTPAGLLPTLIKLSETELTEMVKQTTLHAINYFDIVAKCNEGSEGWATLSISE